jgi:hypothetical protein
VMTLLVFRSVSFTGLPVAVEKREAPLVLM